MKIGKLILDGKDQDNLLCLIEIIRQSEESRVKVLSFVDYLESRIVNNDVVVLEDAIIRLIKQYDSKCLGAHSLIRRLRKLVKSR